jgi:Na+(H+)/acetate symporter ActP
VACLAWAALICHALGNRSGAGAGATVGAVVGVLLWLTADFFNYGFQTLISLQWAIIDPLLSGVLSAIAGAVIGIVVGKLKSA